eukprot:TRINITY_DN1911_c0_g6_i1.p1 TRINITY_DN1911_c0_g6~~TRINITY_DN1911_c0_g6_i1.p1  ORF type:complete len:229 (-),score=30.67 TRINITY_DN1911_c0_g6_i1:584-1270(-)
MPKKTTSPCAMGHRVVWGFLFLNLFGLSLILLYLLSITKNSCTPLHSTSSNPSPPPPPVIPKAVRLALQRAQETALQRLQSNESSSGVFDSVIPMFPGLLELIETGNGEEQKGSIALSALISDPTERCIVVAAGIADDDTFEFQMAQLGCDVFAFDCTLPDNGAKIIQEGKIKFRPWCIGESKSFENNKYFLSSKKKNGRLRVQKIGRGLIRAQSPSHFHLEVRHRRI